MFHFFALLFWVAGGLAFVAAMPQLGVAVFVVVVLNAMFAIVQEERAEHAAERLRDLLPRFVTVVRDGVLVPVPAADVVVGDVVAGCFVVEGEADATVVATGSSTRLAGIASLTQAQRRPASPLHRELVRVSRVIAASAIGTGVGFFLLAVVVGMPASDGFLFAVGVTVALVPEGLLPTVTLSLAVGAQRMAARHALVRRLEAVETGVDEVHLHGQDGDADPQRDVCRRGLAPRRRRPDRRHRLRAGGRGGLRAGARCHRARWRRSRSWPPGA
jgi:magnesium-transporting ATPase (P-type)